MYSPTLGRFLSRDPLPPGSADVLYEHPFVYARNNPTRFVDPSGLKVVLRCGPVQRDLGRPGQPNIITLGYHCAIVVNCGEWVIRFDGGGIDEGGPTARPTSPKPAPGETDYPVSNEDLFSSCEDILECLNKAYETIPQPPYGILGPNSNTYVKCLLSQCGLKSANGNGGPPRAIGWDFPCTRSATCGGTDGYPKK